VVTIGIDATRARSLSAWSMTLAATRPARVRQRAARTPGAAYVGREGGARGAAVRDRKHRLGRTRVACFLLSQGETVVDVRGSLTDRQRAGCR